MTLYVAEHDEHHALFEIPHEQKVEIQATLLKEVVVIIINIRNINKYRSQRGSRPLGTPGWRFAQTRPKAYQPLDS